MSKWKIANAITSSKIVQFEQFKILHVQQSILYMNINFAHMFLLKILHLKLKYSKCNKNGKLWKIITFALKFQNEQTWSQNVCLNKLYPVVFHLDKIELKFIMFSSVY